MGEWPTVVPSGGVVDMAAAINATFCSFYLHHTIPSVSFLQYSHFFIFSLFFFFFFFSFAEGFVRTGEEDAPVGVFCSFIYIIDVVLAGCVDFFRIYLFL